jgi:AbrB family transcriptional regulator (stage V sporulation protein T)
LRLREGTPLEIFTDREGDVILKKYSPIVELGAFASQYADSLAQTSGCMAFISDRDQIIAVAGGLKKELLGKQISDSLEELMLNREVFMSTKNDMQKICLTQGHSEVYSNMVICPIISEGNSIGLVGLIGREGRGSISDTEKKLASAVAGFLGRHMES